MYEKKAKNRVFRPKTPAFWRNWGYHPLPPNGKFSCPKPL